MQDEGEGKGKDNATYAVPTASAGACHLFRLPPELIDSILLYLCPVDLVCVSETCRVLYSLATTDHIWQTQVQANVPGQRVTSPYPFDRFRDLFWAHSPRWFLTKGKIWFSDTGLPGRLILVRYDQRRGCIEGYQLVANKRDQGAQVWHVDNDEITVPAFDPEIRLHLDNPIIRLSADPVRDLHDSEDAVVTVQLRGRDGDQGNRNVGTAESGESSSCTRPGAREIRRRFHTEIPMRLSSIGQLRNSFIHARCLPPGDVAGRFAAGFPYKHVWPPPAIPRGHRVLGSGLTRSTVLRPVDFALSPLEVCEWAFRTRKWIEIRALRSGFVQFWRTLERPRTFDDLEETRLQPPLGLPEPGPPVRLGEEISTYATLHPALYTPTTTRPFRGIFVGDYGPHGCEFLWVYQSDDDKDGNGATGAAFDPDKLPRRENETDAEYAARKRDATIYRGRLKAVKLTGDANVPRGEISFFADDLGDRGFVMVSTEPPFVGVRVVRSVGHIANNGFTEHTYVPGRLLLVSPDVLVHDWVALGHCSYFRRVNIDTFLA